MFLNAGYRALSISYIETKPPSIVRLGIGIDLNRLSSVTGWVFRELVDYFFIYGSVLKDVCEVRELGQQGTRACSHQTIA